MKTKFGSFFLMFLILVGLVGIIQSLSFSYVQAKVLPLAMSSAVFVLSIIELVRDLRRGKAPTGEKTGPGDGIGLRRFGVALSWVVGFSLGVYLLGFVISIPVFVVSYLKVHRRGWLISLAFAAIILALIYGMYEVALRAPLYKGLLFGGR